MVGGWLRHGGDPDGEWLAELRASWPSWLSRSRRRPRRPAVIGFDDVPAGTVVDDEYAARGVRFGPSPFAGISGVLTTVAKGQARTAPNVAGFAYSAPNDFSSSWIRFDEAKVRSLLPAVRLQIARGGLRLARLLDEAFATPV